jgi:hypothetical protein
MLFRPASARGACPARALLIESLRLKYARGWCLNRRRPEGPRQSCPLQCLFALYPLRTLLLLLTLQLSRYCCLPARSPGSLARIAAVFRGTPLDYHGTLSVSRGNFPVAASRCSLAIVSAWHLSYRPTTTPQRSPNDPPRDEVLTSQEGRTGVPAASGRGRLDTVSSWKPAESHAPVRVAYSGGWVGAAFQAHPSGIALAPSIHYNAPRHAGVTGVPICLSKVLARGNMTHVHHVSARGGKDEYATANRARQGVRSANFSVI